MAEAISYCDSCGTLVPPSELATGRAVVTPQETYCSECFRRLSEAKQQELLAPKGGGPADRPRRSSRTRSTDAGRSDRAGPPPSPMSKVLPLVIVAGVLAGVATVLIVKRSQPAPDSNASSAARPQPKPDERQPDPAARMRLRRRWL